MNDNDTQPEDLPAKIEEWLGRNGYPLELEVAERMRQYRVVDVTHSRLYVDPETKKIRETDVVGSWGMIRGRGESRFLWTHLYLVVECKAKPQPWVIFDDGAKAIDEPGPRFEMAIRRNYGLPEDEESRAVAAAEVAASAGTLFGASRIGSGIVEAFAAKGTSPNNGWAAVQDAVSAARGVTNDLGPDLDSLREGHGVRLVVIPLVVTSGLLFRGWLADDGRMRVEAIERGDVLTRPDASLSLIRCIVVTAAGLDSLLAQIEPTVDFLVAL